MKVYAIIPSGGIGRRINSSLPKQYIKVHGKELIAYTLEKFQNCEKVDEIIIPAQKDFFDLLLKIKSENNLTKLNKIVEGGKERQESVLNALNSITPDDNDLILVHDAARPLLEESILNNAIETAKECGTALVALKAKDTIIKGTEFVSEYLNRNQIFQVQTPQIFSYKIFQKAIISAENEGFLGTDESILVHRASNHVKIVEGSSLNFKITTDSDLDLFRLITHIETL